MQTTPGILDFKLNITPINRISPSRYERLKKCALSEVWSTNRQPRLLPMHLLARLGTAIHSLLEEAGSGKISSVDRRVLENRWEELIAEIEANMRDSWLEQHLVPFSITIRDYEVRRIRAIECAIEISKLPLSNLKDRRPISIEEGYEVWVESQDGLVGGFIDFVYNSAEGPVIRDYKSGNVLDKSSGDVRSDYGTQLKLYAALYKNATGMWPVKLEIVPLQGAPIQVEFEPDECIRLYEDAISILKKTNSLIVFLQAEFEELEAQLADPSASNCKHCLFRPGCNAYIESEKLAGEAPGWPEDVIGILEEIRLLGNSKLMLAIQTDANIDSKIYIRGLQPDTNRHPAVSHFQKGDRIGLFNLYSRGSVPSFTESQTTTIYKMVEA